MSDSSFKMCADCQERKFEFDREESAQKTNTPETGSGTLEFEKALKEKSVDYMNEQKDFFGNDKAVLQFADLRIAFKAGMKEGCDWHHVNGHSRKEVGLSDVEKIVVEGVSLRAKDSQDLQWLLAIINRLTGVKNDR